MESSNGVSLCVYSTGERERERWRDERNLTTPRSLKTYAANGDSKETGRRITVNGVIGELCKAIIL